MHKTRLKLYTGGCSFLARAYDNEEQNAGRSEVSKYKYTANQNAGLSFPAFLSAKLNAELVNDARPGHSNKYIIRKFYDFLYNKPQKEKAVAILGLTELARHEIPILKTNKYHHITPSDYHFNTGRYENYIEKYAPVPVLGNVLDHYYQFLYNDHTAITELVQQLNMLTNYAARRNTDVIVFCSFALTPKAEISGLLYDNLSSDKNDFRFFNFGQKQNNLCTWVDFILKYAPNHVGGHPLAYDNNVLANMMVKFFKEGKFKEPLIDPSNYASGYNYSSTKPNFPKTIKNPII